MKVVGLTGGIATGKSTVASLFAGWGASVLDADQVAREVVEPGTPALVAIVDAFGSEALDADGRLDRPAMRRRIASDPDARRRLEAITHPAILQTIAERLAAWTAEGRELAVVEAALMVETGSYRMYPQLVVVSADPEVQVRRVMARDGVGEQDARALLATQLPMAAKEAVATHVIRNDADRDALEARAREVFEAISRP
ncbi:MAG: dephospho-CoA kinase [Alphaproteobacteria bacterium]|nr:dephospho-CoA kinase [Alphaproteobacteria bacterium]MCB9698295.1 dephospho-CoA kinase [Alphaproteobacteria bacterium]